MSSLMERTRQHMRSLRVLDDLRHDVRYAARFLRSSPAFTTVAVLSLAVGIGANTAVFSLVDRMFVRAMHVPRPEELYSIGIRPPEGTQTSVAAVSNAHFRQLREQSGHLFTGMFAATDARRLTLTDRGEREDIPRGALLVSGEYFSSLGVRPLIGRALGPDDDRAVGAHPVVVLGNRYWLRRFGADSAVVGRTLLINDHPFVVVGVMPQDFSGTTVGQDPALYMPLMMDSVATRGPARLAHPGNEFLQVMGRLRSDVDPRRAAAEITPQYQRIALTLRGDELGAKGRALVARTRVLLMPAGGGFGGAHESFRTMLTVLSVMVMAMLLIACANVGSLLVARSASRQREVAVRLSLGAGRWRIIRQLLTESMLLAIAGGALGLLLAHWTSHALAALLTGSQAMWLDLRPDARVLAFTTAVSVLSVAFFGLLPAIGSTRVSLTAALRGGTTTGRSGMRVGVGKTLVTAQVALSVLLVAGATLFTRSLKQLYAVDVGFDREQLLVVRTNPTRSGYQAERARLLYGQLLTHAGALPGVRSITLANATPFDGADPTTEITVEGYVPSELGEAPVRFAWVGPAYFATLRQPLLQGRDFSARDDVNSSRVAVVNEAFVRKYLRGRVPLGARIARGNEPGARPNVEIVGVVRDAKDTDLRAPAPPLVYLSFFQNPRPARGALVIRTAGDPTRLAGAVRAEFRAVDAKLEVLDLITMAAELDDTVRPERVVARLSEFFAAAALLLACVGLYGVMAYAVARRTTEIGIRIALGAEPQRVARGVVRETMRMVLLGLALGVPAALASAWQARSLLFELSPADPMTLALTAGLLAGVAIVAAWLPSRRAARVDPLTALRYE